jgi:hypothetical protein
MWAFPADPGQVRSRRPGLRNQTVNWPLWRYHHADRHRKEHDRGEFHALKLP